MREAKINKASLKKILLGNGKSMGILIKLLIYAVLIGIGFVFLYPIIIIVTTSMKDVYDLANPLVNFIPTHIYFQNYITAFNVIGGWKTLLETIVIMLTVAVLQTGSSAIIAYGFAKFDFWGKPFLFLLMVATLILPPQITFLPKYVLFNHFNMLNTVFPVLLPPIFGQGLKNAIFILIFYQFFKMAPKSLDEAAEIDGAGPIKIFLKINLKSATPAFAVCFMFSLVWNWNETYMTSAYFGNSIVTLPMALERFEQTFSTIGVSTASANTPEAKLNLGIIMAGTFLTILPLCLFYGLMERKLVESFDKAGITGE